MTQKQTFTRFPRLAAELAAAGIQTHVQPDIYSSKAGYHIWFFTLSRESAAIVTDFYNRTGRTLPDSLRKALAEVQAGA